VAIDLTGGVIGREAIPFPSARGVSPERLAEQFEDFVVGLDLPRDRIEGLAVVASTTYLDRESSSGRLATLHTGLPERIRLPVIIENDAAAAALGEFWSRRISREEVFGCVYLSTEIGAGLVIGGALFRGAAFAAGELGHVSIDHQGRLCPCGNRGCVERYASMTATVEAAREEPGLLARLGVASPAVTLSGAYDTVARAAVTGDPAAFAVIDRSAGHLGVSVTSMVNLLDLGRLVLTGPGVALAGSIYARRLRTHLARTAHARGHHDIAVELSAQPRDAAGIGAAALVVQASIAPGHTSGTFRHGTRAG